MKYIKTYEAYNDINQFTWDVVDLLYKYSINSSDINKYIEFYSDEIVNYYNDGKMPSDFVTKIVNDLELGEKSGLPFYTLKKQSNVITYL